MKEVLIIADSDPRKKVIGGVGIYSYNLAKYLTEKGFKVIFVGKKQEGEVINKLQNFDFIELNKRPNQSNYVFLKNLFKLAFKLKLNGTTVIHSQRPDWIVPFAKFPNRKIVTLHGSHLKNVYLKKGFVIGKIYSKLEKKGLEIADVVISVSEENTNYYKKIYENDKEVTKKFITIPIGIDLNKFQNIDKNKSRKQYGFKKSDKVVVYVGRLEKEKNLQILIRACHEAGVKLFIVGEGREEEYLKKFASSLNSQTIFHKSVNNEKIPNVLACGDIFALTSLHEGMPTVVIEALAAGLPVISTNVGDVHKIVINGKTGFIVNEQNITGKLKNLIKKCSGYRNNCIKISKTFSWDLVCDRIQKFY